MPAIRSELPLVSVIIPVRQWEPLEACLKALKDQTYSADRMEILVIDNGEETDVPKQLPTGKTMRILRESKPGSYAARNAGIKAAAGEIFAFTDADCIPASDWIEKAITHFQEHPNVSRLAGKIELTYRLPTKRNPVELFEKFFAFQQERKVKEEGSAITANMFAKREVFEAIGDFDESLKSGGDTEWGIRAATAGFRIVYLPDVKVLHPARYGWRQLYTKTVRLYGGKWQRAHSASESSLTIGQKTKIIKPGTPTLRRAFATPELSFYEKLQVSLVIVFVGASQVIEHVRLLFGGSPRHN